MRLLTRTALSAVLGLPMTGLVIVGLLAASAPSASAAQAPIGLGTATSFAVLAGTAVTNTGPTDVSGDIGVSPGTAVTGFPPGNVTNGTVHSADAVALQAQQDLTTAYNDAAGRGPAVDKTGQDLGGQTLVAGVYGAATSLALTGTVTLDAQGDPGAVFVFQAGSTLLTASNSTVALIGGAQACHVFWQVGSSATLGVGTTFVGTVMALASITVQTGASVQGRVMARNGQVSLDHNTITRPDCSAQPTPTPTTSVTPTATSTATATSTPTSTGSATSTGTPTSTNTPTTTNTPTSTGTATTTSTSTATSIESSSTNGPGAPGSSSGSPSVGIGTPHVPTGHPGTGRDPVFGSGSSLLLWGALGILGAGGAALVGSSPRLTRALRRRS